MKGGRGHSKHTCFPHMLRSELQSGPSALPGTAPHLPPGPSQPQVTNRQSLLTHRITGAGGYGSPHCLLPLRLVHRPRPSGGFQYVLLLLPDLLPLLFRFALALGYPVLQRREEEGSRPGIKEGVSDGLVFYSPHHLTASDLIAGDMANIKKWLTFITCAVYKQLNIT